MIGIFDSGSGGLTVLRAIRERAPDLDIVYFGDTKNAPYGNKSREELSALTARGFQILKDAGATQFVSACNSISASVTERLLRPLRIDIAEVVEMSEPSIKSFEDETDQKILLVATTATIESGMYQDGFTEIGMDIETSPIPDLAGAIERGESAELIETIIRRVFAKRDLSEIDFLFLGCTHFPLVSDVFKKILREEKSHAIVFDPALPVAREATRRFGTKGNDSLTFLLSAESDAFSMRVSALFGEGHSMKIV